MLHNKLVNFKVPIYFKEKEPPVISYKYTDNIFRKVFNYNQSLSDVTLTEDGNWNQSCDCKSSTFCYEPHGHIITGDLRIVKNRKLRRLLSKGPKYREENTIDWDLNKNILMTAVDDYAKNWSKRGVPVSVLNEWSLTLKLIISNKINSFKQNKDLMMTYKKLTVSPLEAEKPAAVDRQNEYLQTISQIPASRLHFFDESSVVKTTGNRRYGSARLGERAVEIQRYASNATYTINLLHSLVGVDCFNVLDGASNGEELLNFLMMHSKWKGLMEVLLLNEVM